MPFNVFVSSMCVCVNIYFCVLYLSLSYAKLIDFFLDSLVVRKPSLEFLVWLHRTVVTVMTRKKMNRDHPLANWMKLNLLTGTNWPVCYANVSSSQRKFLQSIPSSLSCTRYDIK